MNRKQKINRAIVSTGCLLTAYVLLQLTEWFSLLLGEFLSGFQGHIYWDSFTFYVGGGKWNTQQVVSLYLFPEIVFFFIFLAYSLRKNRFTEKPKSFALLNSWFFLLIIVKVLFLPLWQIIENKGIYYAFSWLWFSRTEQDAIGFFLLGLFIFNITKVSSMFSYGLEIREKQFLRPKYIQPQLIFLWVIPFLIFSSLIYIGSGWSFVFPNGYWLAGIAGTLLVNFPVISSYQVIVK